MFSYMNSQKKKNSHSIGLWSFPLRYSIYICILVFLKSRWRQWRTIQMQFKFSRSCLFMKSITEIISSVPETMWRFVTWPSYRLARCPDQHLHVVASSWITLQVVDHVQEVHNTRRVGRQRQTVPRCFDLSQWSQVQIHREVELTRKHFKGNRKHWTAQRKGKTQQ